MGGDEGHRGPPEGSAAVRAALRLYGWAARSLPADFRAAYGKHLLRDVEEILERHRARRGTMGLLAGLVVVLWDLGAQAARERGRMTRDWGEGTMNGMREIRVAVRSLLRRPGFTVVATTTLALGIGSVLAIFTLVNAILLQPLPYPDSDRIVEIMHHAPGIDLPDLTNSPGTLALYRENAEFLSVVAGVDGEQRVLTGLDRPDQVEILSATPEIFQVLGVVPAMGRPFGETDAAEGAPPVAVLAYDFWASRMGADPDILGKTLELDGVTTEVVGVMPEDFRFVQRGPVALVPLTLPAVPEFGTFGMTGLARLAPGVTLDQAQTQIQALQSRLPDIDGDVDAGFLEAAGWSASVRTLKEGLVEDVATTLWLVLGTVGFVLLIACANVANLFLVRAEGRQKEVAVRAAMGAGRGSVAATFLHESLVLSVAGGLLGVLVARVGVGALVAIGPQEVPRIQEVALTPLVLGVAAVLAVATGALLGLLPMTRYSARTFAAILRDGGRGSTDGRSRHRARNALVMSQLALALVLLVGSGLMFRTFAALRQVELGFETEGILALGVSVGEGMDIPEAARFYEALAEEASALPGVVGVGVTTQPPLASGNANGGSFNIRGRPRAEHELPPVAMYRAVGPGYFEAMGIPILMGRDVEASDLDGSAARVWIDEDFARIHFDGDPIGQAITWEGGIRGDEGSPRWAEITGVVGNVKQLQIREDPSSNAYFPLQAGPLDYPSLATASLVVRVAPGQDPTALAPALRDAVSRLDGRVPVTQVRTVEEIVSAAMAGESITLILLGIAAGMALFLGAIGLFGVISYVVSQRTREIGVRIALGADGDQVSGMVLRQGLAVAVAGVALGLAGALGLTRLMGSLLYGVSATDPLTFVAAPAALLAVSALAAWLPARRAARVDPMASLRQE
ncbi:MAG TPA: ABC transporter permease [Longimicrobiales bacterium]|nr:ABC transporter permease [Longimicrobiales bacterium]